MEIEENEPKAITIKNIDFKLFHKFKIACAQNQINMRQAILEFMAKFSAEKSK